jgi:co-chaperonin GroES (HSP10)
MDDAILSYDDKNIDYSNITLCMPSSIHGGSYFTKMQYSKKPLYMQSPTCISKQGIVHSGKKTYIDLVFTSEKDGEFISFLENLEKKCIDIIYEKRHLWFTDDLEKTDIETAFASLVKSYKNGTSHTLRVAINNNNNTKLNIGGVQSCFIFDEQTNALTFDDVKPETLLITIIDFEGIKFTSKSFQFEINARQILTINENPIFKSCLIKQKKQQHNDNDDNEKQDEKGPDGVQECVVVASDGYDAIEVETLVPKHLETLEPASAALEPASATLEPASATLESLESLEPVVVKVEEPVVVKVDEPSNSLKKINSSHLEDSSSSSLILSKDKDKNEIDSGELIEVTLDLEKDDQKKLVLNNPDDVYYKMYKDAKEKAKAAKNIAIEAYLAAEEIKLTYNLNNIESSDSSDTGDSSDSSDNDNSNDNNNDNNNNDNNQICKL